LYKSEPSEYSIDDLAKCKDHDMWDGVRSHVAKKKIEAGRPGDLVLFYHSNNGKETGIAGVARLTSESYPDPTDESGKFKAIDMKFVEKWEHPVTLIQIKAEKETNDVIANMQLFTTARLSVQEVTPEAFEIIETMRIANEEAVAAGDSEPAKKKAKKSK
jgi:predicted RNA-binding protein with PUA-like domain